MKAKRSLKTKPGPDPIDRLYEAILKRRGSDPAKSYTAKLFLRGRGKIAQKLGEEAVEVVIDAIRDDRAAVAEESADLLYHLLVLWADMGLSPADVHKVLASREGVSGIIEKANRKKE
ncbi:MAG TPA: phosphoribosyl-ATP diphosphatase [Alphaproteobacteria bacterium]|nr:phosphoribosyl-ATP diphosphatase [Alphaproteobacteria bacterium]